MKFGISTWSYPWSFGVRVGPQPSRKMTAMELMEKVLEYKVELVQFAENLPLDELSRIELEEVKTFADRHGIALEAGTKGNDEAQLMRFLEIAKLFESPVLRVLPAFFGSAGEMAGVEENIRKVLPAFEEAGITIVLENTEAFKADEYVGLMERVSHPCFRMCLDLANALGCMEGPEYVMERLLPWVGNFHFKDVKVKRSETVIGFSIYGVPSGQGDLDLPWALENFRSRGLDPSVIIEHWPPFTESIERTVELEHSWVKESVDYMRLAMG